MCVCGREVRDQVEKYKVSHGPVTVQCREKWAPRRRGDFGVVGWP